MREKFAEMANDPEVSNEAIAEHFRISTSLVWMICKRLGIKRSSTKRKDFNDLPSETIEEIMALAASGVNVKEIAARYDLALAALIQWLKTKDPTIAALRNARNEAVMKNIQKVIPEPVIIEAVPDAKDVQHRLGNVDPASLAPDVRERVLTPSSLMVRGDDIELDLGNKTLEEEARQDIHDMRLGLYAARTALHVAAVALREMRETGDYDARSAKTWSECALVNVGIIRRIRGMDEKKNENTIQIAWAGTE
jgi:transposase-like protein